MSYAQQQTFTSASTKNVSLTNDQGGVDQDSVQIPQRGSVTWFSNGHGSAKIVFDGPNGSPFSTDTFHLRSGGSIDSGEAVRGSGTEFKYTVHGEKGENDPVVVVDP